MQITIYSGFSKEVNSTKQPTGGTAVNCCLKENTSVIKPVFILNGANFSTNYVSWNGRFYWVDDIVSIRNGAVELHCSVDVLASYKSQIGASTQYVTRAASRYDPSIVDNMYPTITKTNTLTNTFSTIHSQVTNGASYVLGVLGGGSSSVDGVKYYILTPSDFAALMNYLSDETNGVLDAPVTEISKALQKELVNPFQYIVSCMYFPFTISSAQVSQALTFGWWTASGFVVDYIDPSDVNSCFATFRENFTISAHPQAGITGGETSYLLGAPYTKLLLHCYGFGDVPIDATLFKGSTTGTYNGKLEIYVDYFSGIGLLLVKNNSNAVVARNWAQFGVPVQISQSNQSLLNSAVGVISTTGAIAQGNFIGVLSGIGDAMQGMLPQVEKSGAYGTRAQFNEAPTLTITHTYITPVDRTRHGSPCMDTLTINSLSGYVQVEKPDVDITGTKEEKNQIAGFMESGFFYE